ncbi:hypothetical protein DL96DRAFT_1599472 [Flagelloscypha sp. PMI_526]|nr:hypothetical protein DL96DRAFT_1599472 [Flagelloscypha sp. PMI_526]
MRGFHHHTVGRNPTCFPATLFFRTYAGSQQHRKVNYEKAYILQRRTLPFLSHSLTMSFFPVGFLAVAVGLTSTVQAQDPCAAIAGQKWVAASDARACFKSFAYNADIKANIVEVVNKTMAFHTSTNYEIQAPSPFDDVHQDIIATLARVGSQSYDTDFDFHVDLATSTRTMGDGHSVYVNMCYDSTYTTYVPAPLVLLEDADGSQNIYIAPEAYTVFSQDFFSGQVDVWQAALGDIPLQSIAGAKVISVNNEDPWKAVDANAAIAGSYQSFATRQNSFFASHVISASAWSYMPGQFAQKALPLVDSVTLTIQRENATTTDTITLPYRSRFGDSSKAFTNSASFWANNCLATSSTNGSPITNGGSVDVSSSAPARFSSQSTRNATSSKPLIVDTILDVNSAPSVPMPASLTPTKRNIQASLDTFGWILDDEKTGVFSSGNFNGGSEISLMVGLSNLVRLLKSNNVERLIIDVSNNQGGLVCTAAYFHYIFFGNTSTTYPQALLPTKLRVPDLSQKLVDNIINQNLSTNLRYHPSNLKNATNQPFSAKTNYLREGTVDTEVNGHEDRFSQTIGQECQPFYYFDMPQTPEWTGEIVIVSNGRCASSCALFVTTMVKEERVKVVSIGGKKGTAQEYAGTIGGQSLDFSDIDTEIKSAGLKSDEWAPPDFITNSYQGITWRLAQGVNNKNEPEEWQSRPAVQNYQLTRDVIGYPWKIWTDLATKVFDN